MATYFPSQAEKLVLVRIPDVTLSLLNHFPSRTLLTLHTLTCCWFVLYNLGYIVIFRGLPGCCLGRTKLNIPPLTLIHLQRLVKDC